MSTFHLAQINIARINFRLDDPRMAGFMSRLDEINALAERSSGFIWRLQTPEGNATYLRPYDDERIIVNMSVWESIEHLQQYVYQSTHAELFRERFSWFERFPGAYLALWWVQAGTIPDVDEGKRRLVHLEAHGPTPFAFTLKKSFPPEGTLTVIEDKLVKRGSTE